MPLSYHDKMSDFSYQEIKTKPDDLIYLFTDGYMDQFDGQNQKKFGSPQFKELLGGKIRVESVKGSVFFFTVPVEKEIENHIISPSAVKRKRNKTISSILVAEDDETNFFYLKALLKQNTTAEIIHASNGLEALEIFQKNPHIGLILMDIKMSVMDGLEATRQIKAINRNVPVIAITAYAMAGDEARVAEAGCDYYLTKPIDKKLLLEKISEFIEI
jgi:CheY-like chemotaxis protein